MITKNNSRILFTLVCVSLLAVWVQTADENLPLSVIVVSDQPDENGYILIELTNVSGEVQKISTHSLVGAPIVSMPEFLLLEHDGRSRWVPRPLRRATYSEGEFHVMLNVDQGARFRYYHPDFKASRRYRLQDNLRKFTFEVNRSVDLENIKIEN